VEEGGVGAVSGRRVEMQQWWYSWADFQENSRFSSGGNEGVNESGERVFWQKARIIS
jgi:hypothetical protein